ncbi:hypothetical protein BFP70_12750 [Thioclava sp. SK-1]|nr:hypothetical protein BFP70_12750 [Thioclava sp. SK-1]
MVIFLSDGQGAKRALAFFISQMTTGRQTAQNRMSRFIHSMAKNLFLVLVRFIKDGDAFRSDWLSIH